jgi:hypothetical protein
LRCIASVFEEVGATWFVFGAQAMAMHGVPRATANVDVRVRLAGSSTQLVTSLTKHGFSINIEADALSAFIAETRVIPAIHKATKIPVDIVLAGPGLEEFMLERAVIHRIEGQSIPVITMEDFLVLKILAGRAKDDQDVRFLLEARSSAIDLAVIGKRIAELEGMLDQSELSPKWLLLSNQIKTRKVKTIRR